MEELLPLRCSHQLPVTGSHTSVLVFAKKMPPGI